MPPKKIDSSHFSPDTREFIELLDQHAVRYVIVGGEAVIFHGYARLTGDVDFFYERTDENTRALFGALAKFWDGTVPGVNDPSELLEDGLIVQFGRPPNRIDLLNKIDGLNFPQAWETRETVTLGTASGTPNVPVHFLSLPCLLTNKEASGRPKDLEDLRYLRRPPDGNRL